ncbi:MAG: hypothetical protein QOJ19_2267 [Acidimicrobiia bacterium]|jgi:nucleoid-associated protein YgaU|nr:hypothetical protein [Acidimicrobiia bacterium]
MARRTLELNHPTAYDIVANDFHLCGFGTAFEGMPGRARVLDESGTVLADVALHVPGFVGEFVESVRLQATPSSARGMIRIEPDDPSDGEGGPLERPEVPITFGLILIPGYQGFTWYEVVPGDTLSDLAKRFLTDADRYPILAEANRDSVSDPNSILVGQQLRIPLI